MPGIFGNIAPPPGTNKYIHAGDQGAGLFLFISNLFKLSVVIAGIFFVYQIISAGFAYMSASGDIKKNELAWAKIYQSILGLVIIASSMVIAGVIGRITGFDLLNPTIYGPN
jgi:hypothetical protein